MNRIQRKRTKGWRMPPKTKCITRPSNWGNPFKVTKHDSSYYRVSVNVKNPFDKDALINILTESGPAGFNTKAEASAHAAMLFGKLMDKFPQNYPLSDFDGVEHITCFCKEGEPCHGDEIIKRLSKP